LGAGGRGFESPLPDFLKLTDIVYRMGSPIEGLETR